MDEKLFRCGKGCICLELKDGFVHSYTFPEDLRVLLAVGFLMVSLVFMQYELGGDLYVG